MGGSSDSKETLLRSNYKLKVGLSRRFRFATDLLQPDFWLARGRFEQDRKKPIFEPTPQVQPFKAEESIDLEPENSLEIDWNQVLGSGWEIPAE